MKTIKASNGMEIIVDDRDFSRASAFRWYIKQGKRRCGLPGKPYAHRRMKDSTGRTVHVYLARWLIGAETPVHVDHRDGNTLNNQRKNLRKTTHRGNHRGFLEKAPGCYSKYRGVSWNKLRNKWIAQIHISSQGERKTHGIGYFLSERDAALAYNKRATKLGFFPEALNKVA